MALSVQEAINRGNNLVATSIIGLAGFAFAPEIFLEDGGAKVDDILLFMVAIAAIVWYRRGQNRFKDSLVPWLFVTAGIIIKFGAILAEIKDKEDVGDDFGGIILFILASIFVYWLIKKTRKVSN